MAARGTGMDFEMSPGLLWQLQKLVFDAKMKIIQLMIAERQSAVGDPVVEVEVRVKQRVIDAEATQGRDIDLPEHMHDLVVDVYSPHPTMGWA